MTDSYRIATNRFKQLSGRNIVDLSSPSGNVSGSFVFVGVSNPYVGSDANVPAPDNTRENEESAFTQMILGKKVAASGINLMTRRIDWVANTLFAAYSDTNADLFIDKNFFSVVNAASYYHVFKCLDNNANAYSTVPPNFSDTSAEDTYYETSDGYVWKYMYSLTKDQWDSFATREFIPVLPSSNVEANAIAGAIDVIKVEAGGAFYSNYIEGIFNSSDIQISGNTFLYGISSSAVSVNGYYTNCIITIKEGTGKGQYREITGYTVSGITKEIIVNSAFTTIPDSTSLYAISPKVTISGDGKETSNVVARALINAASSNVVYKVEILNRGAGYRSATAVVSLNPYVTVSNTANLTVVIPPQGGHGANVYSELGASAIGVSVKLSNTEANTISTDNDYRQIGLIHNPLWSNVTIDILNTDLNSGSNGTFLVGETIYQINPMFVSGSASMNTTSAVVTGTGTGFANVFTSNSKILLKSGSSYFLGSVASVTNATSLTLSGNGSFANASCNVALVSVEVSGYVDTVTSGQLKVSNVAGTLNVSSMMMGVNSFAVGVVNSYAINGIVKGFSTFNQREVLTGTLVSGTFVEDEGVILQFSGSNVAWGNYHSGDAIGGNTKIYLTNVSGSFVGSGNVVGNTSGAIFSVTGRFPGDLVEDSGEILYLENISPVPRGNNQSEIIKIIIEV